MRVVLRGLLKAHLAQMAQIPYLVQLHQQAGDAAAALRQAQADKWVVLVAVRVGTHYLGRVLRTKVLVVGHKTQITTHIQVAVEVLAQ